MRRGVVLGSLLALVLVLPAAAREQANTETVTLKVGQTVSLKTVFDKKQPYTIVMSGLVTRTLNDGSLTVVYDPFHGMGSADCEGAGPSVYLQVKGANGVAIDYGTAGQPPCRTDHRYRFQINERYPPTWDLHGKAKAYITLADAPGWTTRGSFTLKVTSDSRRRDAEFTVRAKKETSASVNDELLADVRLSGSGNVVDLDGDRQARGRLLLTVVWLTRDDTELTLQPVGTWRYSERSGYVGGSVRVVKSSVPRCRNKEMAIVLRESKQSVVRLADPSRCAGGPLAIWLEPRSEVDLTVQEVRK